MCNRRLLWESLAVGLVLALAGAAMVAGAARKSATVDEPEQLWAGTLLLHGDYSVNPHPPLTKLLQAAPLVLLGAQVPAGYHAVRGPISDIPGGRHFLYHNVVGYRCLLRAGRLVNIGSRCVRSWDSKNTMSWWEKWLGCST